MLRQAAVAGQFYPGQRESLLQSVKTLIPEVSEATNSIAVMSPHAGYMYSGAVAGKTLSRVSIPDEIIILGPNHTGMGHRAAVYSSGSWQTPFGSSEIAAELAESLLVNCPSLAADTLAHQFEHSLEVQVPFLQYLQPQSRIVPVCISRLPLQQLLELGDGIARAIGERKTRPLLLASTDMTHFEPGDVAREKDYKALDRVLSLDPAGLYDVVTSNNISMCGVMPTVVMLQAAIALGAVTAELVAYSNSGDITGDQSEVVGYAGVRVY